MKPFKLFALGAVAVALAPAFAMAATLDLGAGADATINTTTSASAGTGSATGADVSAGTDASVGTSGSAQGSGTMAGTGSAMTGAGSTLVLTQQDAANAAAEGTGSAMITSSANVSSDADFASFARNTLRADAAIKQVSADSGSVAVTYQVPGRVLGIFPVTMNATAKVAADGSVTFSYPWYHFLTSSSQNDAAIRTALSTQAAGMLSTRPSQASVGATSTVAADTTFSASEKARILDGMRLVLSGSMNGAASSTSSY